MNATEQLEAIHDLKMGVCTSDLLRQAIIIASNSIERVDNDMYSRSRIKSPVVTDIQNEKKGVYKLPVVRFCRELKVVLQVSIFSNWIKFLSLKDVNNIRQTNKYWNQRLLYNILSKFSYKIIINRDDVWKIVVSKTIFISTCKVNPILIINTNEMSSSLFGRIIPYLAFITDVSINDADGIITQNIGSIQLLLQMKTATHITSLTIGSNIQQSDFSNESFKLIMKHLGRQLTSLKLIKLQSITTVSILRIAQYCISLEILQILSCESIRNESNYLLSIGYGGLYILFESTKDTLISIDLRYSIEMNDMILKTIIKFISQNNLVKFLGSRTSCDLDSTVSTTTSIEESFKKTFLTQKTWNLFVKHFNNASLLTIDDVYLEYLLDDNDLEMKDYKSMTYIHPTRLSKYLIFLDNIIDKIQN